MKEVNKRSVALFDGQCSMCSRTRAWVERVDILGVIECVDLRQPEIAARFSEFTPNAVRASVHVVSPDGEVFKGVEGLQHICGRLGGVYRLAGLASAPGIRQVSHWVYGWFARNRMTFNRLFPSAETVPSCDGGSCEIDWDALDD